MDVSDTKPLEKSCSKCGEIKTEDKFIIKRNICKECRNNKSRAKYNSLEINEELQQNCNFCNKEKPNSSFIKNRKICKDCNNSKRQLKYNTDEEHRKLLIKRVIEFKHNKILEKQKLKEDEIGNGNKKCSSCNNIKPNYNFRNKRLKCKICERDEPLDKFKRVIRSRIISTINHKSKHTCDYLGCNSNEYLKWILSNNNGYILENRGKDWNIYHVIPLSKFNLDDEEEQQLAFNWRNTMPLSCKENLSKNNKILKPQIEQHINNLIEYHKKNNMEIPKKYIDLFAKYLDDGKPLKPSLPLTTGNVCEELS